MPTMPDGAVRYHADTPGTHRGPDDRPARWEVAERMARRPLDRTRQYAIIDGRLCEEVSWAIPCPLCAVEDVPLGCDACGFTGKRIVAEWVTHAKVIVPAARMKAAG